MALVTVNDDETDDGRSKPRWSAGKKLDVVRRLLRGEKLDALSRELGVEARWPNDYGETGYRGPQPPVGDGPHGYQFRLFVLASPLALGSGATVEQVRCRLEEEHLVTGHADRTLRVRPSPPLHRPRPIFRGVSGAPL